MDNILCIEKENGEYEVVENIPGLSIEFEGINSSVIISEGSVFYNSKIKIYKDSKIIIKRTSERGIRNTSIDMGGSFFGTFMIDEGISIESCRFAMDNEINPYIKIGKDCMLSSNITFRATDGHCIIDNDTKELLNATKPIIIGDHVWIGANATILKGAIVNDNSIIATESLVTRNFPEKNIIIGGNPAKILKKNINWSRTYVKNYKKGELLW